MDGWSEWWDPGRKRTCSPPGHAHSDPLSPNFQAKGQPPLKAELLLLLLVAILIPATNQTQHYYFKKKKRKRGRK